MSFLAGEPRDLAHGGLPSSRRALTTLASLAPLEAGGRAGGSVVWMISPEPRRLHSTQLAMPACNSSHAPNCCPFPSPDR
jgi:hypothetical protein